MTRLTPTSIVDHDEARIIERQDGFYCQDRLTSEESGPFATFLEAVAYIDNIAASELEPNDDLKEVEEELGIADWIDPDTGEPAEESVPHIEDH